MLVLTSQYFIFQPGCSNYADDKDESSLRLLGGNLQIDLPLLGSILHSLLSMSAGAVIIFRVLPILFRYSN